MTDRLRCQKLRSLVGAKRCDSRETPQRLSAKSVRVPPARRLGVACEGAMLSEIALGCLGFKWVRGGSESMIVNVEVKLEHNKRCRLANYSGGRMGSVGQAEDQALVTRSTRQIFSPLLAWQNYFAVAG